MGGLILKDLYGLKQQLKIYIIIAVVWLLIAVTTRDMSFFSGLVMMFTFLVPITSLAYDENRVLMRTRLRCRSREAILCFQSICCL